MDKGTFLGPDHFSGRFNPPPPGDPRLGGQSTFNGALLFFNLPSSYVKRVIPGEGFRLAAKKNGVQAPDLHPVMLFLGHHSDLKWLFSRESEAGFLDPYDELALMVPFVQEASSGENWHSFAVRMYLDNDLAIDIGNRWYGFAKERASNKLVYEDEAPATFRTCKDETPYFDAALKSAGKWYPASAAAQSVPNYRTMQAIVSMPALGQLENGEFACSYFQWDYSSAHVRAMTSGHTFAEKFVTGMDNWVGHKIESVSNGAIAVRNITWRIGWPPPYCKF